MTTENQYPAPGDLPALPDPAFGMLAVSEDTGRWTEAARNGDAAFDTAQMIAYARAALAAATPAPAPAYCWAVSGCSHPFFGPHAEDDARMEARRIGGTAEAFPLYRGQATAPAPADMREAFHAATGYDWEDPAGTAERDLWQRAWIAGKAAPAPAVPAGEVVVTTDRDGRCVLVSRQDEDGQILSVIWQHEGPYTHHNDQRETPCPVAGAPVWVRPDDLAKARVHPQLCRVEPAQRDDFVPLYTAPQAPQQAELTDEQIAAAVRPLYQSDDAARMGLADDVRTVRAVLSASPGMTHAKLPGGWKFNHARQAEEPGIWEIGYLDNEDNSFSPIITVDTGLYYQAQDAEPLARAILQRLTESNAQVTQIELSQPNSASTDAQNGDKP